MGKKVFIMPQGMDEYSIIADEAAKTLSPYLEEEVEVESVRLISGFPTAPGAWQVIEGDNTVICTLFEEDGGLLEAASGFAKEKFDSIDNEDALDAVGELLNHIVGSVAKSMSESGKKCELLPPMYGEVDNGYLADRICRVNLRSGNAKMGISIGVL